MIKEFLAVAAIKCEGVALKCNPRGRRLLPAAIKDLTAPMVAMKCEGVALKCGNRG